MSVADVTSAAACLRHRARDEWPWLRVLMAFGALTAVCSGLAMSAGFDQVSDTKWLLTLVVGVGAALLMVSERPRTSYACTVVFLAPFADFNVGFAGLTVSPLVPLLVLGVPVLLLSPRPPRSSSALARLSPWFLVLLLPALVFGDDPGMRLLVFLTAGVVVWVCVRADAGEPTALRSIFLTFLAVTVVQAAMATYEFATGQPLIIYGGGTSSYADDYFFGYGDDVVRVAGTFSDPISLGNVLAMGLPIAVALVLDRRSHPAIRVAALGGAALLGFALAVSYSRMSWNGAALGLVVVVLVLCRGYRLPALAAVSVSLVALGAVAATVAGPSLQRRFDSVFDPTAPTVETADSDLLRERIWAGAQKAFGEHPYLGLGFDNLSQYLSDDVGTALGTHAHSLYLQIAAEAGLMGLLVLVLLGLALARDAHRASRSTGTADGVLFAGACGAIASLVVSNLTDYTARYTAVLALMVVPIAILALLADRARRLPVDPHPHAVRSSPPLVETGIRS